MSADLSVVRVTSYSIHPVNGNVEYVIELGKTGRIVRRRFREFFALREALLAVWDEVPFLPSRVFDTSPLTRLPQLNFFLSEVCETLGPKPPKQLLQFLAVDAETFASARAASLPSSGSQLSVDVGTPQVADKFREEIERTISEVLETAKAKDGEEGWKMVGKQAPFTWMARAEDVQKGHKSNRVAFGELKRCPPRLIHELMLDNDACKQMEPKLDTIKDVQKLDEHTFVQYFVMKSIMFMPPRDVILVRHWRVLPDGRIVHAEFSVDEFPDVPASGEGGRVRAKLTVGGVVLQPVAGDPTSCIVYRVNDMDPKLGDAIPAYALAKLNEFTASMLSNNIFSLAKLVSKSNLAKELAKGPLVNWNGKVEGPASVPQMAVVEIEKQATAISGAAPLAVLKEAGPYFVGFLLGVSTAVSTFLLAKAAA